MATVRPFAALRPAEKYADRVISLPYDVMNRSEAANLALNNPYSFLHICRSEIDLPEIEDAYDPRVYLKAKDNLENFEEEGIFIRDEEAYFYIYRQVMEGRIQTGIVACVSIDEYMDNTIKKHEFTRVEKELDRINHFDKCNANTEPVFLTYRNNYEISKLINDWTLNNSPQYDFTTGDGVSHTLWVVKAPDIIKGISENFKSVPFLYIADGHHRSASAAKVGLKRRKENPSYNGSEEFNFFMAVIFPDSDLHIFDYNRVVKDLNGNNKEEFLNKISKNFQVEEKGSEAFYPGEKHRFSMYLDGLWYLLTAKKSIISNHPIKGLDVAILQDYVLDQILAIKDPRTDNRIDFIGGIRGLSELEKRVNTDMKVAFALHPVSMEDLLTVADKNEIMPPKSTWFEPKLGSGLFVHTL